MGGLDAFVGFSFTRMMYHLQVNEALCYYHSSPKLYAYFTQNFLSKKLKKCIKYTLIFLLSNKMYSSSCKQKMSGKCSFYTPIDNSVSNINMLDPYFITLCHSHYDTSASATIKGLVDLIRVYIQYPDAIVHHLSVTVLHIRGKDKVEFVNPLYWSGERPDVRVVSVSCVQLDVVENHDGGHMVVGYFVAESYKEGHLYNVVCCKYKQIFIFLVKLLAKKRLLNSKPKTYFIINIYFKLKKKDMLLCRK